ncbi:MAG: TRAP transporter large permease [Clostridiales bacterium]|nr:TRAP transporter large permease [Clostridiales bacterium]
MAVVLLLAFLVLIFIGVPIGFAMGLATIGGFLTLGGAMEIIPTKMITGIDNFTFLCIPLFVLASEIMSVTGITKRIVVFCDNLIGHITGGLAHVNVLGSMLFAGITGSATADAAGLGTIEIAMMDEAVYDHDFSAGVTAASAILGPIIPPSMNMVIYAVVAGNVSVVALFLGGIGPGVVIGLALMGICYVMAKRNHYPKRVKRVPVRTVVRSFFQMLPALLMPIIILGGILGGIFTATESAAIAVIYAVIVGIFFLKTITWKDLYQPLLRAAKMTAVVMFIIAVASAMGWALTVLQIPQKVAHFFLTYANNRFVFLLMANVLLLIIGTVMDLAPALLIMVPVLAPAAMSFGIDPIHFGVMVVVNLCIGLITPPVGMTLFVVSNVAKISLSRMYKAILPFMIVEIIALTLITYVPAVTTTIPHLLGY